MNFKGFFFQDKSLFDKHRTKQLVFYFLDIEVVTCYKTLSKNSHIESDI